MEARCTALAVRVAKQKSTQKPKIPSAVQVRELVRKENWDPCTWDGTVSDNDDDCNWEDEVEVRVAELAMAVKSQTSYYEGQAKPRGKSSARGKPRGQAATCTSHNLLAKGNTTCYGTARYRCGSNFDK
ncbi:hypothetical protein NDU88_004496 [Pleurodeles waltl]|uniref:Uncharacterized protein n=1 Tax=Pleurodeles waltl TaxID=8319 RepID=A0AAV7NJM7_PLEWA|nr:hypothetical protein NDU88_004496 [Pleurodeles waltl]